MNFESLYPWSILPMKYEPDISSARRRREEYEHTFLHLRAKRQPEFCPPWVQGATLGWRIKSPVEVDIAPAPQVEISTDAGDHEAARKIGMDQVWRREGAAIALKRKSWIDMYEFKTPRGRESMFLPNGLGTIEWRLGWTAAPSPDFGLLVIPSPECPDLGVEIGYFSASTIKRIGEKGLSIAISPRASLSLDRGTEVARLIPVARDAWTV